MATKKKAARRSKGTNSVYWSEAKERWVADVLVGYYPNGTPKKKRTFHVSKLEAEAAVRTMTSMVDAGNPPIVNAPTLEDVLLKFLIHVEATCSARTHESYRSLLQSRFLSKTIGKRRMDRLSAADIEHILDAEVKAGRDRTAFLVWQVIRAAIRWAERKGLADSRFLMGVDVPSYKRTSRNVWTIEQTHTFIRSLEQQTTEFRALALIGIQTGVRLAELLGIAKDAVDIRTGRIEIRAQLQQRPLPTRLAPLKTEASRRVAYVSGPALDALKTEWLRQDVNRYDNSLGLALLNGVGSPWRPEAVRKTLASIARDAGIPALGPHEAFRHGYATILIASGADIATVSKAMGHSTITLTANLYQHLLESSAKENSETMRKLIEGAQ